MMQNVKIYCTVQCSAVYSVIDISLSKTIFSIRKTLLLKIIIILSYDN